MDLSIVFLLFPFVLILGALVACWVKIVSPGRVIFRQTRIGHGGNPFTIYKFRSMNFRAKTAAHEAHVEHLIRTNQSMTKLDHIGDDRLIFGGCFLRTVGLDELPQLINVLRGEMSLVGPRPCVIKEFELHDAEQLCRFSVLPGVTGAWQVNRSDETTFRQMVEMDSRYAAEQNLWGDLGIMFRTPFVLLRQMNQCCKRRIALRRASKADAKRSREVVDQSVTPYSR